MFCVKCNFNETAEDLVVVAAVYYYVFLCVKKDLSCTIGNKYKLNYKLLLKTEGHMYKIKMISKKNQDEYTISQQSVNLQLLIGGGYLKFVHSC